MIKQFLFTAFVLCLAGKFQVTTTDQKSSGAQYSLSGARVTLKTRKDNKEFPSVVTGYLPGTKKIEFRYAQPVSCYLADYRKNKMAAWIGPGVFPGPGLFATCSRIRNIEIDPAFTG